MISTYLLQTKCEFPDLNPDYMPPNFSINGKGALYLERQGRHIWMKNLLDITLNITFPPLLSWVPEYVLQNIVQSVRVTLFYMLLYFASNVPSPQYDY